MDPRFNDIVSDPANTIFAVVFFPDRIYHEAYLNATRSPRYRYNVQEVRGYLDVNCLKGRVYMDGVFLGNFIRIEYRGSRLTEQVRLKDRFLRDTCTAWVRLTQKFNETRNEQQAEALLTLHYDHWIDAFQVEIWETLDPPPTDRHDFSVLSLMGRDGEITRIAAFDPLLVDVKAIKTVELAFREPNRYFPFGRQIDDPAWDNNYGRTHQEPRSNEPSSPANTVEDLNYLLDFQRGWYKQASDVTPVRYRNAMMLADRNGNYTNPDAAPDNIIEMRWLFQRELGGTMIFFHEVTVPPGKVEGNHQHIGSEELYYIVEGEGIASLRVGDDPSLGDENDGRYTTEEREVFGLGRQKFKALPVKPGSMIYTKSGGMHGIRNPGGNTAPLKFVAFLYHSS
jgi:hypothetical protein